MSPRRNWDSSSPLPSGGGGGRHTRLWVRGWGPNSDDWRKSLALCLLCGYWCVTSADNVSLTCKGCLIGRSSSHSSWPPRSLHSYLRSLKYTYILINTLILFRNRRSPPEKYCSGYWHSKLLTIIFLNMYGKALCSQ
jgi:hypothetical protein